MTLQCCQFKRLLGIATVVDNYRQFIVIVALKTLLRRFGFYDVQGDCYP